jgi:membrane protein implicated in regulation of membrane protease activity
MTIGGSVALIIIGAILKFGVTWQATYVDLQVIGVILMIAGVAGLIVSVAFLATRRRRQTLTEVYEERRYTEPPA